MGSDESKQKKSDFHHPVLPEMRQAIIDTGGVTDWSIIDDLKDLSPLEMRLALTVRKWKPFYSRFNEARDRLGSKRQREKEVNAIVKAERILSRYLPLLSAYELTPGEVPSLITRGKWSEWLKQWPSTRGTPSQCILASCAEDLAKIFKRGGYRKPPWTKIGEIISAEILNSDGLHKGDLGNWICQIVKRHRKHQSLPSREESSPTRPTR